MRGDEGKSMISFRYDNILYGFDDYHHLMSIKNTSLRRRDIVIPKVFPNGQRVDAIATQAQFIGKFNRLHIDDAISCVWESAFECADVREVVWPKSCEVIPEKCFAWSKVRIVTNVNNVCKIERSAFLGAKHLLELDLSQNSICIFESDCFSKASVEAISLPYYCSLECAFG